MYHARARETRLFHREGDAFELSTVFKEGKGLPERTRSNALFLSVVAQFNGATAQIVLQWFRALAIQFGVDTLDRDVTLASLNDKTLRVGILSLLKQMDVGIAGLVLEKGDPSEEAVRASRVTTLHRMYDGNRPGKASARFDLDQQESEGTRKLFAFAGFLFDVLREGKTLLIDALDARLHPMLTESIIRFFHALNTNPNNAQLIFTTHDTNLLSNTLFRRDQIWFTEKNKYGVTALYALAAFTVRNDASYKKEYLAGKYGAVPFVGGLRRLVGEEEEG